MIGYRSVNLKLEPDRVTSVFKYSYVWRPGLNVAHCIKPYAALLSGSQVPAHEVPGIECACGFYAWNDPLIMIDDHTRRRSSSLVMIKVAASGTVIEHEHGWRSSEVTPLAVVWADGYSVGMSYAERVAELLEVPFERIDVEYELDSVHEWITHPSTNPLNCRCNICPACVGKAAALAVDREIMKHLSSEPLTKAEAKKVARELYGEP